MKAWKKYIFLFFAYSITLLHTLIPHQHQQEVVTEAAVVVQFQAPACTSLVSFFQFLFAADLGSNHLEKFKKGTVAPLDLTFASILLCSALTALLFILLLLIQPNRPGTYTEKLRLRLLPDSCRSLRAPPAFA